MSHSGQMPGELDWLTKMPAHDVCFRYYLQQASPATILQAIEKVVEIPGQKTVERALRGRLKSLEKAGRHPDNSEAGNARIDKKSGGY